MKTYSRDAWIVNWDGINRAHDVADLNYLLHAACAGGLFSEAKHLFKLLGDQATPVPWSYFGSPTTVITKWHRTVML